MIICAAIKLIDIESILPEGKEDLVICGHRHGDCFEIITQLCNGWRGKNIKQIQGFMNHKGEFLDRKEAFEHAKEIGQCNATQRWYWDEHKQTKLYSEDLY